MKKKMLMWIPLFLSRVTRITAPCEPTQGQIELLAHKSDVQEEFSSRWERLLLEQGVFY